VCIIYNREVCHFAFEKAKLNLTGQAAANKPSQKHTNGDLPTFANCSYMACSQMPMFTWRTSFGSQDQQDQIGVPEDRRTSWASKPGRDQLNIERDICHFVLRLQLAVTFCRINAGTFVWMSIHICMWTISRQPHNAIYRIPLIGTSAPRTTDFKAIFPSLQPRGKYFIVNIITSHIKAPKSAMLPSIELVNQAIFIRLKIKFWFDRWAPKEASNWGEITQP